MGWFQRKPKLVDDALNALAGMFVFDADDPTPGSELLDPCRLDFTIESLVVVDAHLEQMRTRGLTPDEEFVFALRCGAYVGEVVRANAAPDVWHWLDYREALRISPDLAKFDFDIGVAAVLWRESGTFCFPIAKVIKYLLNGSEDSVHYFARCIIARV